MANICSYNKTRPRGHDIKLGLFNRRIQALARGYLENDVGVLGFNFGEDFSGDFSPDEVEQVNVEGIRYQGDLLFESHRSIRQVDEAVKQFEELGVHSKAMIEPKIISFTDYQLKQFQAHCLRS